MTRQRFFQLTKSWPLLIGGLVLLLVWVEFRSWPDRGQQIEPCQSQSLAANIQAADLIVVGQVFLVVSEGSLADVIINPTVVYKGQLPGPTIKIAAKPIYPATDRSVTKSPVSMLNFTSQDSPYLLMLKADEGGYYNTNECLGTRRLDAGWLSVDEELLLGVGQPVNRE